MDNGSQGKTDRYLILLEDIQGKLELLVEWHASLNAKIDRKIDQLSAQTEARFDVIEGVLKRHSTPFDAIETRLGRIEHKVDHVIDRVDRHDQEMSEIRV